jgi:2-isopropylmalate synthase
MGNRIYIFDTTLRDGEQSPGVSLNIKEKLEIATQLAKLGVDVIEAGFPIASEGDFEAVKAVAQKIQGPTIAALARVHEKDIDRAWEAVQYAKKPRIHTFIATSDIHMQHKLKMTREEVLKAITKGIRYAKQYTNDIEFSPEDGSRTELTFMLQVVETAIAAGATVINIPDTVGYGTPQEFGAFIKAIKEGVPNMSEAILSVHCHNDLGLAVANSLAAIENGAEQIECTMNGIGERAGNTALEELVMNLLTRKEYYHKECQINTTEIYRTSRLVSSLTGMQVQSNKAIVGKNAFAHESGIHQDGVLKERSTYEIMNPVQLGIQTNNLILGKHSGRHAFRERLMELGYDLNDEELVKAFIRFKNLADRKKEITDRDLEAIIENEIREIPEKYSLEYLQILSGNKVVPSATLGLKLEEEMVEEAACGNGAVDAVFKAIDKITQIPVSLVHYDLNAVTGGKDAMGEVTVKIEYNQKIYVGRGLSTDIIEASAKAYLNTVNKIMYENNL